MHFSLLSASSLSLSSSFAHVVPCEQTFLNTLLGAIYGNLTLAIDLVNDAVGMMTDFEGLLADITHAQTNLHTVICLPKALQHLHPHLCKEYH